MGSIDLVIGWIVLNDFVTLIMKKLERILVLYPRSWDDDLGYKVNQPKCFILSDDVVLNCVIVVLIALLSCWLLNDDVVHLNEI